MKRETKDVIIVTWRSGLKQVFEKNQEAYDMIVYESVDIEELEYSELVTIVITKDEAAQ
tara:strand:- start:380 stop:556 length:177 start_codon:yes stop_codon:yes gene_type:complete